MPNRIIKESTFTSERIAELSDFQFRLWVGLITQADDAGRGDARPAIIKGRVFALRDRVTTTDIGDALNALAARGCVSLYTVDGKPYYEFPSWAKHQRVRDVKSKFPSSQDSAAICGELPQTAASCGELPPKSNPIQSESNPNPNPIPPRAGARVSGALTEVLNRFAQMRREKDKPLTETEKAEILKMLDAYPEPTRVKMVEQSIQKGWVHIYDLKDAQKGPKMETERSYDLKAAERRMETCVPQLGQKRR